MIIHSTHTAHHARKTFTYYFSALTGHLLHFASPEQAHNTTTRLIEIIVDATLYADDIDEVLDKALKAARLAVTTSLPSALPAPQDEHRQALCRHLSLNEYDPHTALRMKQVSSFVTPQGEQVHLYIMEGKTYRVSAKPDNAPGGFRGTCYTMDSGKMYDIFCATTALRSAVAMA